MSRDQMAEFDVAVLGAGSGGALTATRLAQGSSSRPRMTVAIFEPSLVGGECPFLACIPSKVLLSRAQHPNPDWKQAVARRDEITHRRDDASHAAELQKAGAVLVRASATVTGPGQVRADGVDYRVKHIVVATGAAAKKLQGIDCPDDLWDSADAMSSDELPASLVIVGGGPIGCELSEIYARFGTKVTVLEMAKTLLKDVEAEISHAVQEHLERLGVTVLLSAALSSITAATNGGYIVNVKGRQPIATARVLVGIGKTPRLHGIGLETLGLDPDKVRTRLQHVVQPFPTISQLVGLAFEQLAKELAPST